MYVAVGPTGRVSKGHVLDVNQQAFERALQAHDELLYARWNPNKLKGWGCWEIRRRPDYKVPVDYSPTPDGGTIWRMEYREIDTINHVLDCAFLNYDQIRKIKEIDVWTNQDHFIHNLESKEASQREAQRQKAQANLQYAIKQHKKMFEDFRELVRSGKDPGKIVLGIDG